MVFRNRRAARRGDADEDLMEAYRDGDVAAFEELLSRHERKVYAFILRHVRDREIAHDLLQEAFLRVVKNAKRYTRQAKFTTWLYTIARNLCVDHARRMVHRRHKSLDQPQGADADGQTLLERLPGTSPDGHTHADAQQVTGRVEAAIAGLSEDQREVFVMRQFQSLKFREIADIVGVSENTIKSRMRYALENLRLALADYAEDLPGAPDAVPARSRA
ncbi:MAG: RNA polymerase sigma factor [Myxococcales bacterium]|nr:RNA polymerase sigma factor [Myxococcales bacterium]MCB9526028.1 RNA polymerase sigma factor [Myxococcales bacterium]